MSTPSQSVRDIYDVDVYAPPPPPGHGIPVTPEMLERSADGDIQGLTQNWGMGHKNPVMLAVQRQFPNKDFGILSTLGGLRDETGMPLAYGYHTGHWELDRLAKQAASTLTTLQANPFYVSVSDPCDGRTMETDGMRYSLVYRNDAAVTMEDLIRSLPNRKGYMLIATCDKGTPAALMAMAGQHDIPTIYVPGGVSLPGQPTGAYGEKIVAPHQIDIHQIRSEFHFGNLTLEQAQAAGCAACGTPGGGCQFLGTAATAQVVGEALGLALPHTALSPSGTPIWLDMATHSAQALYKLWQDGITTKDILTEGAIRNAMRVHAAVGGSTNLLFHVSAIAYWGGLPKPTIEQWQKINGETPLLMYVIPNYKRVLGKPDQTTVHGWMAGGVPEVMLHLSRLGMLDLNVKTVTGESLGDNLAKWEVSERRARLHENLREKTGLNPEEVIYSPESSRQKGLTPTLTFIGGNLAPDGAVIKSSAVDPAVLKDGSYLKTHRVRVFTNEHEVIAAAHGLKTRDGHKIERLVPGDVVVLIGLGPTAAGMPEILSTTSAIKAMPNGNQIAVLTDGRFSGVTSGACIGHISPEAAVGGPIGKLQDGDLIEISFTGGQPGGVINFIGNDPQNRLTPEEGARVLAERPMRTNLESDVPERISAQFALPGGGAWEGCYPDWRSIRQAQRLRSAGQPAF